MNKSQASLPCVLVGQSIDCLTTAVVLASLGESVVVMSDTLESIAQQYRFEYELFGLYELYKSRAMICVLDFEATLPPAKLYWLFLSDACFEHLVLCQWIQRFNMQDDQSPIVLSGALRVGEFSRLAQQLTRPLVSYLPFVFLMDGQAFASMLNPHLLLIGQKVRHSLPILSPILQSAKSVQITDMMTAEFARSSIMAMLATRVSLVNELSRLADHHHVDITKISHIMGQDGRIGASYLRAGTGFGGKSLPNEMAILQTSFAKNSVKSSILSAVFALNEDQKELLFRKFWCYFDGFIDQKHVLIVGGSYKSGSGRTDNGAIHVLLPLLWSYQIVTYVAGGVASDELERLYGKQALFCPSDIDVDVQAIFVLNRIDCLNVLQFANGVPIFDANVLCQKEIAVLTGDYVGIGRAVN